MHFVWIGAGIVSLFGIAKAADETGQVIESTAELTKQAAKAGLVAGGVYALYLAHKKGVI